MIENCEGPELLRAFYKAISTVTVLDPTCGSGAFLFAALNILEPLYEACLDRMRAFVDDLDRSGERHRPEKFSDFRRTLAEIERHPNRRYFILKSIIVKNLYGVDIMQEAVEICKLRLFLKLVAQVDEVESLEPLPDIDFNIRAGNTLVGFVSVDEIRKAAECDESGQTKILFPETEKDIQTIEEDAQIAEKAFQMFHEMQTKHRMNAREFATAKKDLRDRLNNLSDKLDQYLAKEHGVNLDKKNEFEEWWQSHQPFHWFVEFYGIMKKGGFNVIIGNPPYVEYRSVRSQYTIRGYKTESCGNLYAFTWERCLKISLSSGRIGLILPISAVSTPRMLPLMELFTNKIDPLHISNFAVRPGKLFTGADMNLSIVLGKKTRVDQGKNTHIYSTTYNRWRTEFRPFLFSTLVFVSSSFHRDLSSIPKLGSKIEASIAKKLDSLPKIRVWVIRDDELESIFYHSGGRYFRKCLREQLSNEYKELRVKIGWSDALICLLSSSLYYWLWINMSDCYHVTKRDIEFVPVIETLAKDKEISQLARSLLKDLWSNTETRVRSRADGSIQNEINFNVGKSKSIIDLIDAKLAQHFKMTEDELDFVINFDIKFRTNNPF